MTLAPGTSTLLKSANKASIVAVFTLGIAAEQLSVNNLKAKNAQTTRLLAALHGNSPLKASVKGREKKRSPRNPSATWQCLFNLVNPQNRQSNATLALCVYAWPNLTWSMAVPKVSSAVQLETST